MEKMLIRLMLAVMIIMFMTPLSYAEMLIYEPFDYAVGILAGNPEDPYDENNTGFGLDIPWSVWGGEDALVENGNLIHPFYNIEGTGNHAVVVNGMIGSVFTTEVQGQFIDDGKNYWLSFLYQAVDPTAYGEVVLFFSDDKDVPEVMVELDAGEPALSTPDGDFSEADVEDPEAVMWILIKAETTGDSNPEMCYMWVDPMPGMEPDVADADAQVEYNIPSGTWTYFFWWAGYSDTPPTYRFDEIKIATEFDDVSDLPPCHLAYDPRPVYNAINVDSTIDHYLEWEPPTCIEPEAYDVYFGEDPNISNNPLVVDNQNVTSCLIPKEDLDYSTTYYWRVDVMEPNDEGVGYNIYEGLTWLFTTAPRWPVITLEPKDVTVAAGDEASFTVESLNNPDYQWYYSVTPDGAGDPITDATFATYTKSNVQEETDEGYYYCVATNAYGEDESFHARLLTERLMANWKFEGNLDDEIDPANNGTSPNPISFDAGVDEGQAVVIVDPNQFVLVDNDMGRLKSITITAWLKPITLGGEQVILAATEGSDDGTIYLGADNFELLGEVFGSANAGGGELTEGEWNLCVLRYYSEAEEANLYLNGELVASSGINSEVPPILPPLSIGAKNLAEGDYVDGLIDDVRIYNYPVSHLDIARMYTDTIPDSTACLGNPEFDLNEDCVVNILDFEILASNWANCNIVPDCQFSLP